MEQDSDEDDIWNYKSAVKGRTQQSRHTQKASSSGNTPVKLRTKARGRQSEVAKKNQPKKQSLASGKGKCATVIPDDGIRNNEAAFTADVIDVDLVPEDQFVSSKMWTIDSGEKLSGVSCQQNSSIKNKKESPVKSGFVINKTKIKGKLSTSKKCSPAKVVAGAMIVKSPRSKLVSMSPALDSSLQCHNILTYFSSSSETRKTKRKSSESVDSLFDFTDDELLFNGESKVQTKHTSETGVADSQFLNINNSQSQLFGKQAGGTCDTEVADSTLLKIDHSQSQLCVGTYDCVKRESFAATNERSTSKEDVTFDFKNASWACNSPNTPSKVVRRIGSNHNVMTGDEIINPVASLENRSNAVAKLDNSLDECAEGGFLVDADELDSNSEDEKTGCMYEADVSSSPSGSAGCTLSLVISGCDIPSAELDAEPSSLLHRSIEVTSAAGERHGTTKFSSVQNRSSSLEDKCLMVTTAKKQTSIFSFFKAKFGSGSKTTTKSLNNKIDISSNLSATTTMPGSLAKVAARPDLHRGKTSAPSITRHSVNKRPVSAINKQDVAETVEPQKNNARNKRQCPFYKKIPNTGITVDAFSYGVIPGCEAYVLTHFHYDHYGGLTKRFAQPIYCSQVTGNLVEHRLGVDKKWINLLPLWNPCQVAGVTLTLMEANHCPGAVMILFELKDGRKMVHTGDFRASQEMEEYPMLKNVVISDLYLDTTYCSPSYTFPTQSEVINIAVSLALDGVERNPQTLIVCGTYTIGKEKIFSAIATALDSKICVTRDKKKVLDCLEDKELRSRLTLDWSQGRVHVLPMGKLNQKSLFEHHACHRQFQNVLAFEPTGWTYSGKSSLDNISPKWSRNGVTLYGLPYSEHSSYLELKRFIQFLRPKKIIPTVNNGNPTTRQTMEETFTQWMRDSRCPQK